MKSKKRRTPSKASKSRKARTPSYKKVEGKCIIPGPMPTEALGQFIVKEEDENAHTIRSYIEWQTKNEKVKHLEKVATENIFGRPMDSWDVRTNKNRWWVITNPINLYSQQLFPSLDYTISFHVGVMTRVEQAKLSTKQKGAHDVVNQLQDKIAHAYTTLFAAKRPEEFQSVGMKCRECLLHLIKLMRPPEAELGQPELPQAGNFILWAELIANSFAPGSSNEKIRSHLKDMSKSTWQLVNWLTHAQNAGRHDSSIGVSATENLVEIFVAASVKHKSARKAQNPKRP